MVPMTSILSDRGSGRVFGFVSDPVRHQPRCRICGKRFRCYTYEYTFFLGDSRTLSFQFSSYRKNKPFKLQTLGESLYQAYGPDGYALPGVDLPSLKCSDHLFAVPSV